MLYLNEQNIGEIGIDWQKTVETVNQAVDAIRKDDFSQPVKPYLRYRDLTNRIIAMPAFLGGKVEKAGIKWISSFPGNIDNDIPRAHCVVVLNDANTGKPVGIVNTPLLSVIRTASVTGLMIKKTMEAREFNNVKLGIVGWGPIGRYHYEMCKSIIGDRLEEVRVYDIRSEKLEQADDIKFVDEWQEAYKEADIFITCTVSDAPYIDMIPKDGSLHLNVSLRDYMPETMTYFKDMIVVDDWDEICRENTDIEVMHKKCGLKKSDTVSLAEYVANSQTLIAQDDKPVFFNPMGMATFDIALASYYFEEANKHNIGIQLN